MKTTIKTGSRRIIVEPSYSVDGNVLVTAFPDPSFRDDETLGIIMALNQDQIGALIFALEQAAEAAQMADRRVAA